MARMSLLEEARKEFPEKFAAEIEIFSHIHRDDRIFITSACSEPHYLVQVLMQYVGKYPKAFFDAEVIHIWTLGIASYTEERLKYNFRHNSFFIAGTTRNAINQGLADYTPIFLSEAPHLISKRYIPIDVALIQTSLPPMIHLFEKMGFLMDRQTEEQVYELKMAFGEEAGHE